MNGRMKANWLSPCRECDATVRLRLYSRLLDRANMAPIHTGLVRSGAGDRNGCAFRSRSAGISPSNAHPRLAELIATSVTLLCVFFLFRFFICVFVFVLIKERAKMRWFGSRCVIILSEVFCLEWTDLGPLAVDPMKMIDTGDQDT